MKLESTISGNQFFIFILGIGFSIPKQMGRPLLGLRNSKKNSSLKYLGRGSFVDQGLTARMCLMFSFETVSRYVH